MKNNSTEPRRTEKGKDFEKMTQSLPKPLARIATELKRNKSVSFTKATHASHWPDQCDTPSGKFCID